MELECGGHKGGWMRIADLDTSRGDDCPSGWTKITTPVEVCKAPSSNVGCYSTNFSILSIPYSKVCGMAVGYQSGNTDVFAAYLFSTRSINGPYIDGLSITYGTPRKHIWTYAIGVSEQSNNGIYNCPCSRFDGRYPPSFVHENYYCESGATFNGRRVIIDDPCNICTHDFGNKFYKTEGINCYSHDNVATYVCIALYFTSVCAVYLEFSNKNIFLDHRINMHVSMSSKAC